MGYRQCEYETFNYSELKTKKLEIANLIDDRIKKLEMKGIHYKKICKKEAKYYKQFEGIYELKCCYCGINTSINSTSMFEVDHFINEKQKMSPDGNTVDHITNLVFACRKCNQAKGDFHVNDAYQILHPDQGILSKIFERNSSYQIIINAKYANNETVKNFYNKLGFSERFRKLDYLLLNLHYMKDYDVKLEVQKMIADIYIELLEMRNKQI